MAKRCRCPATDVPRSEFGLAVLGFDAAGGAPYDGFEHRRNKAPETALGTA